MKTFDHPALHANTERPLIYTALSKHLFYFRSHISKFVFDNSGIPVNVFMMFDYFLLDTVERDVIRGSDQKLLKRCDEVWVFGAVSNGVLVEILTAKQLGHTIRYFKVEQSKNIIPISIDEVEMEEEVADFKSQLL